MKSTFLLLQEMSVLLCSYININSTAVKEDCADLKLPTTHYLLSILTSHTGSYYFAEDYKKIRSVYVPYEAVNGRIRQNFSENTDNCIYSPG